MAFWPPVKDPVMRLNRVFCGVAVLLSTAVPFAQAQSLKELHDAATRYDAAYLAAQASAQAAQLRVAQAEAAAKGSVSLTGSATATQLDAPRIGSGDTNPIAAAVAGRYPLINRTTQLTIEQARKSLVGATADLEAAQQDLILRLSQAYFDVLAAQDALATSRANKAAITEQLASARRNFEVGTATITDTREAQARFDLATAQEIAADNDLQTKRIALDQLVGRHGVQPKGLALPATLPAVNPADAQAWVQQADARHPSVRKARMALELARLEIDRARAATAPTVDAVGSLNANRAAGSSLSVASSRGVTQSASLGVQLTWPLYTGGGAEQRVKETQVLEDKARNDLEAARRGVAQITRQAYFGVQSLMAQVKALEAAESSSQLALEATQLGYRVGVRVNLDVLNAQTQLFQTRRDLAKSRYEVLLGQLRLKQASGQLQANDVDAVNALLQR